MKILVCGATGRTGTALVRQALVRGHHVTAYVRSPHKLKTNHENLTTIQGDILNYSRMLQAMQGQEAVFSLLGASGVFRFDQAIVDGIQNILRAMEAWNVRRIIYMSSAGVKESRSRAGKMIKHILPTLLPAEVLGHEIREEIIKNSRLQWTMVRPVTLTNDRYTGQFRSGEGIFTNRFMATISRADVAHFMLQQLHDNTFARKAPMIMY